ncbi:MAG: hypothetical protein ACTSPV_13690 [Candidatus Hodarchaeales archaeon]
MKDKFTVIMHKNWVPPSTGVFVKDEKLPPEEVRKTLVKLKAFLDKNGFSSKIVPYRRLKSYLLSVEGVDPSIQKYVNQYTLQNDKMHVLWKETIDDLPLIKLPEKLKLKLSNLEGDLTIKEIKYLLSSNIHLDDVINLLIEINDLDIAEAKSTLIEYSKEDQELKDLLIRNSMYFTIQHLLEGN